MGSSSEPVLMSGRLKDNLGKVRGTQGEGDKGDSTGQQEGVENDFVRASKEKFSEARKALDDNSFVARVRWVHGSLPWAILYRPIAALRCD